MNELEILRRRFERERQARLQAEGIMEHKASELFDANEKLRGLNERLESQVKERTLLLRESEEKYRGIIENMELGLLEVDNDDVIVKPYERFCKLIGYEADEMIGRRASDIFLDEELRPLILAQAEARKTGDTGVYEMPMRHKDGHILWALISGAPIFNLDGEVVGSIGIHYDISDKKKLIEDLNEAKKVAEESRMAEKQFLANMSHEIRTPLNAIIGMAHLLYDTSPTIEQKEYLDVLKHSSNFLHSLISDILDMSKIEAGRIEVIKREIDIVGIVKTQQKAFELKTENRPIEIEALIDTRLEGLFVGDELLINQILNNLLSNAEKFTEKGTIELSVRQIQKLEDEVMLKFTVSDTGIGIPAEELEMVFQKFKQISNDKHQKNKGTGLGLSIVKQLVEILGGEIWVESTVGKGTIFSFTMPLHRVSADRPVPKSLSNQLQVSNDLLSQMRVLMVEDNAMNRKYLGTILERWQVNYDTAVNGKEALRMSQIKGYDLILMDIQMPIMDGYEATLAIRNTQNVNQNTPIIALTASAMNSQKGEAYQVGMNDYLSKPFTPEQLLQKLKNYAVISEKNIPKNSNEVYFSSLNKDVLEEMYGNDYDYAADMFNTFLNDVVPEIRNLATLPHDLAAIRKAVHKLKPTFGMVGLTEQQDELVAIENECEKEGNIDGIRKNLASFLANFEEKIPILKNQMNKFLKQ